MPNRILKESICSSDTVDLLSAEEERLFTRLITKCDDFGCFDARPAILRAECFPLKVDQISLQELAAWTTRLASVGLIRLYTVNGRPYLQMVTWLKHQQRRATKPKYPLPDATNKDDCTQLLATASSGNQIPSYSYPVSGNVFENENDAEVAKAGRPPTQATGGKSDAPSGAPPSGGISLYDRYVDRLKPAKANRAGILAEAFLEIFGRAENVGRLGALAKSYGSTNVLTALLKTLAQVPDCDEPLNYAEKIMANARAPNGANGRAEPHYLNDAEADERRKEDLAWTNKVLGRSASPPPATSAS